MAYRRRRTRRSTYRSRGYSTARRSYGRRRYTGRRRRRSTGGRTARIVVQVVGGGGAVPASPVALGMKAARPVRARY